MPLITTLDLGTTDSSSLAACCSTLRSTKRSCATLTGLGEDIGEISQCEVLVEDDFTPRVGGLRKVFKEATTLHNVALPLDVVKVMVEKVQVVD